MVWDATARIKQTSTRERMLVRPASAGGVLRLPARPAKTGHLSRHVFARLKLRPPAREGHHARLNQLGAGKETGDLLGGTHNHGWRGVFVPELDVALHGLGVNNVSRVDNHEVAA